MINRQTLMAATAVALIQKEAATSDSSENCDATLEAESKKLNKGGEPAAATENTNGSDSASFDTKSNTPKQSGQASANTQPSNEDVTPRSGTTKEASLSHIIMNKLASIQANAGEDKDLESESDKELTGGSPEGEVTSGAESEKAPAISTSGGDGSNGDVLTDTVPRSGAEKTAAQRVQKASAIYNRLVTHFGRK